METLPFEENIRTEHATLPITKSNNECQDFDVLYPHVAQLSSAQLRQKAKRIFDFRNNPDLFKIVSHL